MFNNIIISTIQVQFVCYPHSVYQTVIFQKQVLLHSSSESVSEFNYPPPKSTNKCNNY